MPSAEELKAAVEVLKTPPFSQKISVIQLHDEATVLQLCNLINTVLQYIDDKNPNSPHRVDVRSESPEDTINRILSFSAMLKYQPPMGSFQDLQQVLLAGDREAILSILCFLTKDIETHRKRAYLAPFLTTVDVPREFLQDNAIADLSNQLNALQEEFKRVHKLASQQRLSGNATAVIKREIQQMEEEKHQVQAKIVRLKKNVEEVPNHEQWLEAARRLRQEQTLSLDLATRLSDQKSQMMTAEQRLAEKQQNLKDIRGINATSSPEILLQKLRDEARINAYLADEKLPKTVEQRQKEFEMLQQVLDGKDPSQREAEELEREIALLKNQLAKVTETKLIQGTTAADDRLSLFRQQASIISHKRARVGDKLNAAIEEAGQLAQELEKKQEAMKGAGSTKMLKGEEFKRYVSDLRGKSTVYKRMKIEISELTAEYGILSRTEEILKAKESSLREAVTNLEKKMGVAGFQDAQEILEKVSEKKSELDEEKGKTLNEISEIVQKLMAAINEKKSSLNPVIQELRTLRNTAQELETNYLERKKDYDAVMVGLEAEMNQLEQDVRILHQEITNDQSRYRYLHAVTGIADVALDKILAEMKAYIGGDEAVEASKKVRGFKTYRDLYNRKITEQENLAKVLKEQQTEVKASHDKNVKQLAMFEDARKLLQMKVAANKAIMARGGRRSEVEEGTVMQDRLVL